jgi:hypothetical protein
MADKQAKQHAETMLRKFFPHSCSGKLFGMVVATKPSTNGISSHKVFLVHDIDDQLKGHLTNVNLYIANLCGFRLTKDQRCITGRETIQEIAETLQQKLGYKVVYENV